MYGKNFRFKTNKRKDSQDRVKNEEIVLLEIPSNDTVRIDLYNRDDISDFHCIYVHKKDIPKLIDRLEKYIK